MNGSLWYILQVKQRMAYLIDSYMVANSVGVNLSFSVSKAVARLPRVGSDLSVFGGVFLASHCREFLNKPQSGM